MPHFIKVATTDELADQQAKLFELEGQKMPSFVWTGPCMP